jgi:hypothetical protein
LIGRSLGCTRDMNTITLPVPANVVVRNVVVSRPAPNKAVKALEEREAVAEVLKALNRWAYEAS